jgi:hypothetical protein
MLLIAADGCGGGNPAMPTHPAPQPQFITIDAPGAFGTSAQDINVNNDIAGFFTDPNNASHGFLRTSGGTFTVFDAPGAGSGNGQGSDSQGINASGTIVGSFLDPQLISHGYIRTSSGVFSTLDVPGSFATMALGINDGGAVTGEFLDFHLFAHGFVRSSGGTFTNFDVPGSVASYLSGTIPARINSSGTVTGFFADTSSVLHAFFRASDGTITTFDAPGAGTAAGMGTVAADINASGIIVGLLFGPNGSGSRSFVRDTAGNITVFDPPGVGPLPPATGTGSAASGINSGGTIAGTIVDANNVGHGYIRNPDGSFVIIDDPNATTVPGAAVGTIVHRINAAGAVVGVYFDANPGGHGFARE